MVRRRLFARDAALYLWEDAEPVRWRGTPGRPRPASARDRCTLRGRSAATGMPPTWPLSSVSTCSAVVGHNAFSSPISRIQLQTRCICDLDTARSETSTNSPSQRKGNQTCASRPQEAFYPVDSLRQYRFGRQGLRRRLTHPKTFPPALLEGRDSWSTRARKGGHGHGFWTRKKTYATPGCEGPASQQPQSLIAFPGLSVVSSANQNHSTQAGQYRTSLHGRTRVPSLAVSRDHNGSYSP
jgi:hypothetical protein